MNAVEQELIEKISHLAVEQQQRVLEFVEQQMEQSTKHYTAQELMKMPYEQREAIFLTQLERSAVLDFEIFEAYSEEDLDAIP